VGEIFNTIWDCKDLIQNQLIDYIRTTVVHAGGITHLRRIADLASLYQVRTGSHGATDLSLSAWAQPCTLTPGCPTLAYRNSCRTRHWPTRCSPTTTTSTAKA
jgi:L-alanine-DL-glutamate epimerase-like enolase superfamily enzyme